MRRFIADQRRRERDGSAVSGDDRPDGTPSTVTANTRCVVFNSVRKVLRDAMDNGGVDRSA